MRVIRRTRGDTKPMLFQLLDKATGAAVVVTGYSFLMTVDPDKAPTTNVNNKFQLTGVASATAGCFYFQPTADQANLVGSYYYDVQVTDTLGAKETVDQGKMIFTQDITK